MHINEPMPTTLSIEEQELLATLIHTTTQLADMIERRLPHSLCTDYRQLVKHSLTPWAILHWKLPMTPDVRDREALSLRAALECIGQKLHEVVHEIAEG